MLVGLLKDSEKLGNADPIATVVEIVFDHRFLEKLRSLENPTAPMAFGARIDLHPTSKPINWPFHK